jgi:hypothetical protein
MAFSRFEGMGAKPVSGAKVPCADKP